MCLIEYTDTKKPRSPEALTFLKILLDDCHYDDGDDGESQENYKKSLQVSGYFFGVSHFYLKLVSL